MLDPEDLTPASAPYVYETVTVTLSRDGRDGSNGLINRVLGMFGVNKARSAELAPVTDSRALFVVKQSDGKMRWFARYSNAWEDRDQEIVTEAAHKEYIAWAYDNKTFPELWLWHTGGTRFGTTDWLDFSDGFAHASGIIDEGKESVVDALKEQNLGVSHGFLSLQDGKFINKYRTYEISVLPSERAAVETSGFNVLDSTKESAMAFTDEKRAWLVGALGEDAVANLEKSTEAMSGQLKSLGVAYKESEAAEQQQKAADLTAMQETVKALGLQVAALTEAMTTVAGGVATAQQTATQAAAAAKKSADEQTEDAFLAKVKAAMERGGVVRPTESAANVTSETPTNPQEKAADNGANFFAQIMAQQFGYAQQAAAQQPPAEGNSAVGTVTVTP